MEAEKSQVETARVEGADRSGKASPRASFGASLRQVAGRRAVAAKRIGILLVNLGTPEATDYWSMRRYLKEFLSDPRVIEENRIKWWLILNLIILTARPRRKGRDYETIWNRERNESPLKTITRSQAEKLAASPEFADGPLLVDWGMRYGQPAISERLEVLRRAGCERILLMPLYPQYSAATTASVCDKAFEALMRMRWQPTIRVLPPFYEDEIYIEAMVASLLRHLGALSFKPDVILASFHGVPEAYVLKGDPYRSHCAKTAQLMRERLGLAEGQFMLSFQSRFGSAEWLKPYTDATVKSLADSGVKNLAVVMPGFVADCLETLEEIAVENAAIFREHGGENFAAIPCLNDSDEGMMVVRHLARRELSGWL
jgi:protoporphyrin/coproporphyrin ferrochelatase